MLLITAASFTAAPEPPQPRQHCLSSGATLTACVDANTGTLLSVRSRTERWQIEGWSGFDTCGWSPSAAAAGTVGVATTASSVTVRRVCGNGTITDRWSAVPGEPGVLEWRATFVSASTAVFGPSWLQSHLTFRNASATSRLWVPVGDLLGDIYLYNMASLPPQQSHCVMALNRVLSIDLLVCVTFVVFFNV